VFDTVTYKILDKTIFLSNDIKIIGTPDHPQKILYSDLTGFSNSIPAEFSSIPIVFVGTPNQDVRIYLVEEPTTTYFKVAISNLRGNISTTNIYCNFLIFRNYQDIGNKIDRQSLIIDSVLTRGSDSCTFVLNDPESTPVRGQEIVIIGDSTTLFGGIIVEAEPSIISGTTMQYSVTCQDYEIVLTRKLVAEVYENKTCKTIIEDIVSGYVHSDWAITTNNVQEGPIIEYISFDYITPAECIRKLVSETGYNFYVDPNKDIHFFATETLVAPIELNDLTRNNFFGTSLNPNYTLTSNKVTVIGDKFFGPPLTETFSGDDITTEFNLTAKPHAIQLDENGTSKTVGFPNIDDLTTKDYECDYWRKTLTRRAGALPTGTTLTVVYQYEIRVITVVEDTTTQGVIATQEGKGDGIYEKVIRDDSIGNITEAFRRGQVEVDRYGNVTVTGSTNTYEDGFAIGQIFTINLTGEPSNGDYIIRSIRIQAHGGGLFSYSIEFSEKPESAIDMLVTLFEQTKKADQQADGIDKAIVVKDDWKISETLITSIDSLATVYRYGSPCADPGYYGFCVYG